jgi:hypothetical protein
MPPDVQFPHISISNSLMPSTVNFRVLAKNIDQIEVLRGDTLLFSSPGLTFISGQFRALVDIRPRVTATIGLALVGRCVWIDMNPWTSERG